MKYKKYIIGSAALVIIGFFILFFTGNQGLTTYIRTGKKINSLHHQISTTHNTIDSLKHEIQRLRYDTTYIEKIAREKYGMARSNEMMYKFYRGETGNALINK